MPKKVKQYFGIGSQGDIYIEKKWKTFKGDPIKLEKEWKSTQRENTFLKDRVTALETKINSFEGVGGIKEQLENRILGLQNAHGETFKDLQTRLNASERFANQQATEIGRARNYEKIVRKGLNDLEQECQKSLGNLKTWTENQLRKWLTDIEPLFKKVDLNELYDLVNKGFYAWIHSKKDVASWKSVYELEREKVKERDDWLLRGQKVMDAMSVFIIGLKSDVEKLKDKLQGAIDKGISVGLTAKEHEKHLMEDITRYYNWVKDLDKSLKDLQAEKDRQEALWDTEIANLRVELKTKQDDYDKLEQDLKKWTNTFYTSSGGFLGIGATKTPKTPEQVKKELKDLTKERDDLKTQLAQKENQLEQTTKDFQTKEQQKQQEYLQLLTKKDKSWETKLQEALKKPTTATIGTQTDLTAEQINQMEKDITKYQSDIQKEQNKVSLLQNKLTNLRSEIKDLKEQAQLNPTEKQLLLYVKWKDWKVNDYPTIKNILETGRTISNQWDWNNLGTNYQQIRNKLLELVNSLIEGKENEVSAKQTQEQLEQRNKDLEEKLKEKETNEVETALLVVANKPIAFERPALVVDYLHPENLLMFLEEGNSIFGGIKPNRTYDWTQLRPEYENIRQKLIQLAQGLIDDNKKRWEIEKLTQKRDQLQTQLDLATKTKEELASELQIEKGWWDKWINNLTTEWTVPVEKFSLNQELAAGLNLAIAFSGKVLKFQPHDEPAKISVSFNGSRMPRTAIKEIIYEYYKNQ